MSRSNQKVVPGCKAALDQMKYEIAAELGLMNSSFAGGGADTEFGGELGTASSGGASGSVNWSAISTRQAGSVGGEITKRLIAQAEQALGAGFTL
ncbi:alpha/beta-type small acid-soluble spore protein [Paenibacillus sp. J5C_2022]|uniref:alpha/beta-type small acid-soluble spore protein n=1 Tax=Paenibacillus sp. J5C2022 TaxID=2977129 RepID=UPI0021D0FFEC|nr:alpha/beta-type small acid-soluble spore protein [Paenibacillus sp. J5C2022]MCU6708458.1 alpha/beta-type small acid-soluble spore protein [Paenibacillus sp. J5C2022]